MFYRLFIAFSSQFWRDPTPSVAPRVTPVTCAGTWCCGPGCVAGDPSDELRGRAKYDGPMLGRWVELTVKMREVPITICIY